MKGVLALTAVGLALRLWDIGRESMWLDEAGRVAIASLPLVDIAHGVAVVELSPPLYHYLLHFWMRLAGDGDVAVRLFSALLVVPTVPICWSIGAAVAGRRIALGTAGLAAVSPFAVHYGQEAAMYALLLPLSAAALRSAIGVLSGPRDQRARWLVAYVILAVLSLYTHYYAVFLIGCVAMVGVGHSVARRSLHGIVLWIAAHAVIGLAFAPWLPVFTQQVGLAASIEEWGGVGVGEAVSQWAGAILADGAVDLPSALSVAVVVLGVALGCWRIRSSGPLGWLLAALVVVPLALAIIAGGFLHSFRERGFLAVAVAPWLLVVVGILGTEAEGRSLRWLSGLQLTKDLGPVVLGSGLAAAIAVGLMGHFAERKEDWRTAAALVAASATPPDSIFFVHFGGALPFDRYFPGAQPRVGLPASFDWSDGYTARYRVTMDDVVVRALPSLSGSRQAWAVLSHDAGRGSEYLIAALDDWGTRVEDHRLDGVRVLRYLRAASVDS
ncbi:MAG: rane protein-like protein [Chloroflexi bacterium]|nr:rane protein-like protein [Chloroflexota bacterium]